MVACEMMLCAFSYLCKAGAGYIEELAAPNIQPLNEVREGCGSIERVAKQLLLPRACLAVNHEPVCLIS